MSDPAFETPALASTVERMRPGVTVDDLEPIERGSNAVYRVSGSGTDVERMVLKLGTETPDRVDVEAAVLGLLRDRTTLPVPEPIGTLTAAESPVDVPCLLTNLVPGETIEFRPEAIDPDRYVRLCREAGRHLGRLHRLRHFEGHGPLEVVGDELQPVREESGESGSAPRYPDWPTFFDAVLSAQIDRVEDIVDPGLLERLRAARPALSDRLDERLAVDGSSEAVLLHMDYRLGNLVIDPENDPITAGIIDWGGATAGPAAYERAHTVALLVEWPAFDVDERRSLTVAFREGYGATARRGEANAEIPVRVPAYDLVARLRLLRHVEEVFAGRSPATRESWQRRQETEVDALLSELVDEDGGPAGH